MLTLESLSLKDGTYFFANAIFDNLGFMKNHRGKSYLCDGLRLCCHYIGVLSSRYLAVLEGRKKRIFSRKKICE